MIQAKVVADSITAKNHRLTTLEVVMPRYILAEFNTHRMLGKNSASSRAIPLRKMLLEVINRPFIPYAYQEDHKGMQGTKYLNEDYNFTLFEFREKAGIFFESDNKEDQFMLDKLFDTILNQMEYKKARTLKEWWLFARDKAVEMVALLGIFGVTKQLANRLLEPFMYHKVLVSATEWENFFNLRCPIYEIGELNGKVVTYKSRKEVINFYKENSEYKLYYNYAIAYTDLDWLKLNNGQADIHMMKLAECIYDAMNESKPVLLKEGEWHIPYGDKMELNSILQLSIEKDLLPRKENIDDYSAEEIDSTMDLVCKISIARCARLSYQTLGDNPVIDYEKDLSLYESLSTSGHWSPFEHVAKVMTENEYEQYVKGKAYVDCNDYEDEKIRNIRLKGGKPKYTEPNESIQGWCRNYRGFIQYRELLDN
jgi:thymidylate synthase ThyX